MDGLTRAEYIDLKAGMAAMRKKPEPAPPKPLIGRVITLYRLDTERTHGIRIPPYGVLKARTLDRLRKGLGYKDGMPGDPVLGTDCPQLCFSDTGGVLALEVDPEPPGEIGEGSAAVKVRPATEEEINWLKSLARAPWDRPKRRN